MKYFKKTILFSISSLIVISTLVMFAQYNGNEPAGDNAQPALETVEYSNLTDKDSQELLSKLLTDSGIGEKRQQALFDRVNKFNSSVKSEWLTSGFESAAPTYTKYDPYDMQDMWASKNGSFPGYNCRITAFSLFSDLISAGDGDYSADAEDSLFMDIETLSDDPDALCGDSINKFCAVFAPVRAADSTDVDLQVNKFREGWAARGVRFSESKARMISVVFHDKFSDTDNRLFIGHVGILLPADDNKLYFIEKVAFQEPYRLLKFNDRTELSDYLMEKYDTSWGQDTAKPFIMENDKLMVGYRPDPLVKNQ